MIVDEAQALLATPAVVETVRRLHDLTGIGLVLAGNDQIASRTRSERTAVSSLYAQLRSRVGRRVHLSRPTKDDRTALLSGHGVPVAVRTKLITAAPDDLRSLSKLLRLAADLAGEPGQITPAHVQAAVRERDGDCHAAA